MPTTKATQRLKDTINQSKNRKITQPTQFTTPSTPVTSSVKTYNPDYPWFSEEDYRKLESDVERMGITGANKKAAMNQLYRDRIKYVRNNQLLDERAKLINEQAYHAAELDDEQADAQLRMTEFSQALKKKYNLDATANDLELFKDYVAWLWEGWADAAWQYLSWQNKKLRYDAGLKTFGEKAEEFAVWVAQSPWKRGYNMIGQLTDRIGKRAGEWLTNLMSDEQKQWFIDWLDKNKLISRKDIEEYWAELQRQQAEWTTFNGREQTDIRTPILWEERANSKNAKAWEIVWDIGTAIALTYPLWATLAPIMANSTAVGAGLLGAGEWAIDTAVAHLWSQWDLNITPKELILWLWGWALGWLFTRYLSNLPKTESDNIRKEASKYIERSIKPTVKGKQNQTAYNKFIDDTLDVAHSMSRNKDILQYSDDAWEIVTGKLPTNLRETSEALGNMKKVIYDQYNDIARQAWDAGARVNMNKAFDQLDDLTRDISQNISNPWTKGIVDNFKNTLLEYTDDAGTISIDDAQKITQDFNQQLTAFFKNQNMNDVSKSSIVAKLNKWTKDAIDESIDDAFNNSISNGSSMTTQYNQLKWLYSKIKTIEDEIAKRALVDARKNAKGLSSTIIDSLSGWEFTDALLTLDPAKVAKSGVMQVISKYYNYLNNPNTQIKNLFELVDRTYNPTTVSTATQWITEGIRETAQSAAPIIPTAVIPGTAWYTASKSSE